MLKVGVLSIQGSVIEHVDILKKIEGVDVVLVKYEEQLYDIDGLIIPGGESTAIVKMLKDFNLINPLRNVIEEGLPVWGTCAGLILLAKEVEGEKSDLISVMDINAKRNAYGSQANSFITHEAIDGITTEKIPLIFIRAPYIIETKDNVRVLKSLKGNIVAARQKNMLVTSFHPELAEDLSMHKYFIEIIKHR